jgi:hypothetical protein
VRGRASKRVTPQTHTFHRLTPSAPPLAAAALAATTSRGSFTSADEPREIARFGVLIRSRDSALEAPTLGDVWSGGVPLGDEFFEDGIEPCGESGLRGECERLRLRTSPLETYLVPERDSAFKTRSREGRRGVPFPSATCTLSAPTRGERRFALCLPLCLPWVGEGDLQLPPGGFDVLPGEDSGLRGD